MAKSVNINTSEIRKEIAELEKGAAGNSSMASFCILGTFVLFILSNVFYVVSTSSRTDRLVLVLFVWSIGLGAWTVLSLAAKVNNDTKIAKLKTTLTMGEIADALGVNEKK